MDFLAQNLRRTPNLFLLQSTTKLTTTTLIT